MNAENKQTDNELWEGIAKILDWCITKLFGEEVKKNLISSS